jgi:hypothetical protein
MTFYRRHQNLFGEKRFSCYPERRTWSRGAAKDPHFYRLGELFMRHLLALAALAATSLIVCVGPAHAAATLMLDSSPLWTAQAGSATYPFLNATDNAARGLAYDPQTGHVLVVSRTTGNTGIFVLDGQTGANLGQLNNTGYTGGTFTESMIGIGDDGAIYVANLTTAADTTPFKLYRYASEASGLTTGGNTAPTVVFTGNPVSPTTGVRFGDTMDVRGSGASTQVLITSRSSAVSAVLTAADASESTFNAQGFSTDYTSNLGSAFGNSGSQYYTKVSGSATLRQVTLTGSTSSTTATGNVLSQSGVMDVDSADNLLALIGHSTAAATPTTLNLYDLSDPTAPSLLATRNYPTNNANSNGVGAIAFGNGVAYALATNNGVVAYKLVAAPEPTTLAVFGAGAGALLARRRIRRRIRR